MITRHYAQCAAILMAAVWFTPRCVQATVDFTVACIERTPKCKRYQVQYTHYRPYLAPGTENDQRWPTPGETVTYRAHLYNAGTSAATCTYRWRTNGVIVSSGSVPIAAKSFTNTPQALSFPWPAGGNTLTGAIAIDILLNYDNSATELFTTNNFEQITTRDLALTFYFAQEYFDELAKYRNVWGTSNAVDWTRAQFADMHSKFAQSVYPSAPSGILERVRIDYFRVVPNSQMPSLLGNDPYLNHNDGRWQIYGDNPVGYCATYGSIIDYGLIHEVGHQLGLIDLYNNDVPEEQNLVLDNGAPLLFRVETPQGGMMRGHGNVPFSEFCAHGLNRQLGRRRGYYGDFQFDLPLTNILRMYDVRSNALARVRVRGYRRGTDQFFENANLLWEGVTDASGQFIIPASGGGYATSNGFRLPPHPFGYFDVVGRNQIMVQIAHTNGGAFALESCHYCVLDSITMNLAYWRGQTNTAFYDVYTLVSPDPVPPPLVRVRHSGTTATFDLEHAGATVLSNRAAVAGRLVYTQAGWSNVALVAAGSVLSVSRNWPNRLFAAPSGVFAGGQRSSAARMTMLADLPANNLWGIALLPGGHRLVCTRASIYEQPLWQLPDGRFAGMFSSEHNHLNAYAAAYDSVLERVIFTSDYAGQYRIRVVTRWGKQLQPEVLFGSNGSGDGQFNAPRGVAVDSASRIYVADTGNNRVQAFTASGAFLAKLGGMNAPQGMSVDAHGRVWVADTGNSRVLALAWQGSALVVTSTITGLTSPQAVACGEGGSLFVAEAGAANRISEYTNGVLKATYSSPTDGNTGSLNKPQGLACGPGNHLIVADAGNRRVVELATQPGVRITSFTINNGAGQTASTAVTLRVTASGNPLWMRFGNTPAAVLAAPWLPYTATHPYSVADTPGAPQTLYAQARAANGTTTDLASASITYDADFRTIVYVATWGNDSNSGLAWNEAKASLQGAAQLGTNIVIMIGTGVFSGANNFNLDARNFSGSRIAGSDPAQTTFVAPPDTTRFMSHLEKVSAPLSIENCRIIITNPSANAFLFNYSAFTAVALTLSNLWLTGPYDGDLLQGINGPDGRRNGDAIYFEKWGGSSGPYHGTLRIVQSLFERWGGVLVFNDYQDNNGAVTCVLERCTIVNCANTLNPGQDGSTLWLRGAGTGRRYYLTRCVISHCNTDSGCDGQIRLMSISTSSGHMWCSSNLIHAASLPPNRIYMESASYYTGRETDDTTTAPQYVTYDGRPYVLIAQTPAQERGWYTVVPEHAPAALLPWLGCLLARRAASFHCHTRRSHRTAHRPHLFTAPTAAPLIYLLSHSNPHPR